MHQNQSRTALIRSEEVNARIEELLTAGHAESALQAEAMFLNTHLPEITQLALELDEEAFKQHEAVKLLLSHGSRPFEDSLG